MEIKQKESEYLIRLCSAYLSGTKISLDNTIDYQGIYLLAKSHNLTPTLFCVINTAENKKAVPKDIFTLFEEDFYDAVARYDFQQQKIDELDEILTEAEIRHIFFKGAEIKEYFPVPQARVMGDIDILIDEKNRERVKALLIRNGYKATDYNGPVYNYVKDNVLTEMHTKIISGKVGNSDAEECFLDAMDNAVYKNMTGRLRDSYHLAYLITHLAHHFWFYGAGIKLIMDLAVFQNRFDIDYTLLMKKLSEVGLEHFARVVLTVCFKWFGEGKDYGLDTEQTEQFLISFGAFGNVNRSAAAVVQRKQLEEGKSASPLMLKMRLLFPSYEKMKNIDYMKFIEGRPYLTPAAWAYRLYYNLRYRKKFIKASTAGLGGSEVSDEAQKEMKYFEEIGLL
jgi:hypothetical protein